MRMFRRRADNEVNDTTSTVSDDGGVYTTDGRRTYAATAEPDTLDDGRRWHYGPARALATLLGVGAAGLLVWLTTTIGDQSTGGYWAEYGILAGAGFVLALSQLLGGWTKWGRPSFSPTVFGLAFLPTLVAVGWVALFHQPHSTLFRGDITNWTSDLGITAFVTDMGGNLLPVLAFGLGLVFGFCFDTVGTRRPAAPMTRPRMQRTPSDTDADQPITRERETVHA